MDIATALPTLHEALQGDDILEVKKIISTLPTTLPLKGNAAQMSVIFNTTLRNIDSLIEAVDVSLTPDFHTAFTNAALLIDANISSFVADIIQTFSYAPILNRAAALITHLTVNAESRNALGEAGAVEALASRLPHNNSAPVLQALIALSSAHVDNISDIQGQRAISVAIDVLNSTTCTQASSARLVLTLRLVAMLAICTPRRDAAERDTLFPTLLLTLRAAEKIGHTGMAVHTMTAIANAADCIAKEGTGYTLAEVPAIVDAIVDAWTRLRRRRGVPPAAAWALAALVHIEESAQTRTVARADALYPLLTPGGKKTGNALSKTAYFLWSLISGTGDPMASIRTPPVQVEPLSYPHTPRQQSPQPETPLDSERRQSKRRKPWTSDQGVTSGSATISSEPVTQPAHPLSALSSLETEKPVFPSAPQTGHFAKASSITSSASTISRRAVTSTPAALRCSPRILARLVKEGGVMGPSPVVGDSLAAREERNNDVYDDNFVLGVSPSSPPELDNAEFGDKGSVKSFHTAESRRRGPSDIGRFDEGEEDSNKTADSSESNGEGEYAGALYIARESPLNLDDEETRPTAESEDSIDDDVPYGTARKGEDSVSYGAASSSRTPSHPLNLSNLLSRMEESTRLSAMHLQDDTPRRSHRISKNPPQSYDRDLFVRKRPAPSGISPSSGRAKRRRTNGGEILHVGLFPSPTDNETDSEQRVLRRSSRARRLTSAHSPLAPDVIDLTHSDKSDGSRLSNYW